MGRQIDTLCFRCCYIFFCHISSDEKQLWSFQSWCLFKGKDIKIVQTEIASDPLTRTGFAPFLSSHWLMWQGENIWPASEIWLFLLSPIVPLLFLSVTSSPCSLPYSNHRFLSCYVPLRWDFAPLHFFFWKSKELPDSGLPWRHTQEALLKPRLNPTPLCLRLHTSIHSETSLISWILCCTLTPQRHQMHSTGWYSKPGSVKMSQGEMFLYFCSEYTEEERTIGHLKPAWLGSEVISTHYVLLEVVFFLFYTSGFDSRRQFAFVQFHISFPHWHLSFSHLLSPGSTATLQQKTFHVRYFCFSIFLCIFETFIWCAHGSIQRLFFCRINQLSDSDNALWNFSSLLQ